MKISVVRSVRGSGDPSSRLACISVREPFVQIFAWREGHEHEDDLILGEVHVRLPQPGHKRIIRGNRVGQGLCK